MSQKETIKKERDITIDVLKGIGIILVLIGHSFIGNYLYNVIYSFHMPLFFIAAGYFFKEKPYVDLAKRDFRRLIIPVFFYSCRMLTVIIFISNNGYRCA